MNSKYSVLMSVYSKEQPLFLSQSIDSMLAQTVRPCDFVIVCDGPLTVELEAILKKKCMLDPALFQIIHLKKNMGLAVALNEGLKHCKCELIARMDSDDISCADRCERQLEIFNTKRVDIVSGTIAEFEHDPDHLITRRILPENHQEILSFAKKRNPFNHPCVMYRRSSIQKARGYKNFTFFEDYELWTRMLNAGCVGYNIPNLLLYMRAGNSMYDRRGGLKYCHSIISFRNELCRKGFISRWQYISLTLTHCTIALIPCAIRRFLYHNFLRKSEHNAFASKRASNK